MLTVSKRKILEPGQCGQGERGGDAPPVPGNIPFATLRPYCFAGLPVIIYDGERSP